MTLASTHSPRIPAPIVIAAALAGAILGLFEIANTSIGWHLASGDWVLSNQAFLYSDPFSFTSGGALWIDHEWLFQVGASIAYSLAGPSALVLLRHSPSPPLPLSCSWSACEAGCHRPQRLFSRSSVSPALAGGSSYAPSW